MFLIFYKKYFISHQQIITSIINFSKFIINFECIIMINLKFYFSCLNYINVKTAYFFPEIY
jgi:hypothetical protein